MTAVITEPIVPESGLVDGIGSDYETTTASTPRGLLLQVRPRALCRSRSEDSERALRNG
jgi:hypothetical protein